MLLPPWFRRMQPVAGPILALTTTLQGFAVPPVTVSETQGPAVTGPSSSQSPYLIPAKRGVVTVSLMSVGDAVNYKPDGVTPYRMVGIPDGLGAYDNGDGTFTVVMNHELPVSIAGGVAFPVGGPRESGNAGAFVSRWVIDKASFEVLHVDDLIQNNTSLFLSDNDPATGKVHTGYLAGSTTAIGRLCSGDLAAPTAYAWTDPNTGIFYGTTARIFQSGEEMGGIATNIVGGGNLGPEGTVHYGRQWSWILTDDPNTPGDDSRHGYEIPHCGLFNWENNLASPFAQHKTIVMGMDDSSPGQVYVWIGNKQTTGNVVERAGLTRQSANDNLYVVKVSNLPTNSSGATVESRATPASGTFTLELEGDVSGLTAGQLEDLSNSKGATLFLRPEDGSWDPSHPRDFYFVTTDRYDQVKDGVGPTIGRSRLYRLRFADITQPELGGTIEAVLDGTEAGNMYDNITITRRGSILLQEDVGGNPHLGKIYRYSIANDTLELVATHDPFRFGDLGIPATAPFNQDEESSGIIEMYDILGDGWLLCDVQAHYGLGGELVEGGQLVAIRIPPGQEK